MALILQRRCLCSFSVCLSFSLDVKLLSGPAEKLLTDLLHHCGLCAHALRCGSIRIYVQQSQQRKKILYSMFSIYLLRSISPFDAFSLQLRCHSNAEKLHRTRKNDNQTKRTLTINENSSIILVEYGTCK